MKLQKLFENQEKNLFGCTVYGNEVTPNGKIRDTWEGYFKCPQDITSLEGCPEEVEGNFNIRNNTKQFTEEEVRAVCNVGGSVFV